MPTPALSRLAETLIPSEIVKLGGQIKEKIAAGDTISNFTIGDFDPKQFPIPQELEKEILDAYRAQLTNYPAADGEMVLRKAVSSYMKRYLALDYDSSEILIASGGRPLIYSIFNCIVDEGEKVVYPVPSWNNNHYVHFAHGEHVQITATAENNFLPTAAQIKEHIKGARLLALCSPLNPSGTAFSKEELEAICDLVIEENKNRSGRFLYVMYDQMYWMLTYGETKHFDPVSLRPQMKDYTIYVDGISKCFAATGVRVGWSLGPAHIIAKMRGLNSHIGCWAPMAEQHAVAKYLNNEAAVDAYMSTFKDKLEKRLDGFYKGFIELKNAGFAVDAIEPQAAIYLTVKIDLKGRSLADGTVLSTQEDVTDFLLTKAKLALVPFNCFGAEKTNPWYRLSVGTSDLGEVNAVLARLKGALESLS